MLDRILDVIFDISLFIGFIGLFIYLLMLVFEAFIELRKLIKECRINWYTIMFDDGDYVFAAHNEVELVFKMQSLLYISGKNFIIYKMPYKDCYDVSQWELVIDDTLPDAEVEADEKE